jgi:hypothetical protein
MSDTIAIQIPTDTLFDLLRHLQSRGKTLDPADAASQAITQWLARAKRGEVGSAEPMPSGYQWKTLFLPEGSRLHVFCKGQYGYAYVVGDKLLYKGKPTSPNRFALTICGYAINAWEYLMIELPGERRPKLACVLRKQQAAQELPATAARPTPLSVDPVPVPVPAPPFPNTWPYMEQRDMPKRRACPDRRQNIVYSDDEPFE